MVEYGADREWTAALRALIRRYGEMQAALPAAAPRRGQQFNTLVADLLRLWGIDAEASVVGVDRRDEIDVAFTLDGTPYVLEAKWLTRPVSGDAASKLANRVRQRLSGTRGVVLSMSGYTRDAASAAERGQQPEVLLLDRSHFEAMLSGLIHPEALLTALVQRASHRGGVYMPLADVLLPECPPDPPGVTSVASHPPPWEVVIETAGGITAAAVLLGNQGWPEPTGLGTGNDGRLLVTTADGVVDVDPARCTSGWALPLPGCRATPVTDPDGDVTVLCNYALVRSRGRKLEILGGGFTGNSNLLPCPDGKLWVFDNTGSTYAGLCSLTRIDQRLGDQESHTIEGDIEARNAGWLQQHRFFLPGDSYSAVVDLDTGTRIGRDSWRDSPQSGPRPLLARGPSAVVTVAREQGGVRGTMYQTNINSGTSGRLAVLAVNAVHGLAAVGAETYLLADVSGNDIGPHPIFLQISGLGPIPRR